MSVATHENLTSFTEQFFRSIGSTPAWEGNVLVISNIPEKFESYCGKKGPYRFVFSEEESAKGEYLTKGSYIVTAMSQFLSSRSKKTLLELSLKVNPEQEILDRFTLLNTHIESVTTKTTWDVLYRFTFSTVFAYRNGKKQELHSIYIKDGKEVPVDFSTFSFVSSRKEAPPADDAERSYACAKELMKERVGTLSAALSKDLEPLLRIETGRIRDHYAQIAHEKEEEIHALRASIEELKTEIAAHPEQKEKLLRKLESLQQTLQHKEQTFSSKALAQERDAEIANETQKHGLHVTNKLLNTSIIFIPKYTFNAHVVGEHASTTITFTYDPIQKYMPPLICASSGKELRSIFVCVAGSVCDTNELVQCFEDNQLYCKKFMTLCTHSRKPVFRKNTQMCSVTGNQYAKSYIAQDELTSKPVYVNLLRRCPATGIRTLEKNFMPCPSCKRSVAKTAIRQEFTGDGLKAVCKLCKA